MLTVREAAQRLRLHPDTIRRMAARGDLPGAVKLGGKGTGRKEWRIPTEAIDALLINRGWDQFRRGETHEIDQHLGRQ